MSATDYIYPYDPSGSLASNKIISEAIDVSVPSNSTDASFVIFRASPFFANTLVVSTSIGNGTTLIEGVDYNLTHQFHGATDALSRPVYGGIQFLNHTYAGRVYASYQSLGGDHTLDSTSIAEELTRDYYSIRTMTWDQLKPQIAGFPPYGHDHTANNLVGLGELIDATDRIAAAIQDSSSGATGGSGTEGGSSASLNAHINASQNAHAKSAVQLGNVENFGVATVNDLANSAPNKYVTAGLLRQAFNIYNTDTTTIVTRLNVVENAISEFSEYRTNVNGQLLAINNTFTNYSSHFTTMEENVDAITRTVALNNQSLVEMQLSVNNYGIALTDYEVRVNQLRVDLDALTSIDTTRAIELGSVTGRVDALEGLHLQSGYLTPAEVNTSESNGLESLDESTDVHLADVYRIVGAKQDTDIKRISGSNVGRLTAEFAQSVDGPFLQYAEKEYVRHPDPQYDPMIVLPFADLQVTTLNGQLPIEHQCKLTELSPTGYQYIHNTGVSPLTLSLEGELKTVMLSVDGRWDSMEVAPDVIDIGAKVYTFDGGGGEFIQREQITVPSFVDKALLNDRSMHLRIPVGHAPDLSIFTEGSQTATWNTGLLYFSNADSLTPITGIIDEATAPNTWTSEWIGTSATRGILLRLPEDTVYCAIHYRMNTAGTEIITPVETVFRGGGWQFIVPDKRLMGGEEIPFAISYRTRTTTTPPDIYVGELVTLNFKATNVRFNMKVTLQANEKLELGLLTSFDFTSEVAPATQHELGRFIGIGGGSVSATVDISEAVNTWAGYLEVPMDEGGV